MRQPHAGLTIFLSGDIEGNSEGSIPHIIPHSQSNCILCKCLQPAKSNDSASEVKLQTQRNCELLKEGTEAA